MTALYSCSEDPDVKGTETDVYALAANNWHRCSEDPDVKGTETTTPAIECPQRCSCSEDPDVKGTETGKALSPHLTGQVAARIPM